MTVSNETVEAVYQTIKRHDMNITKNALYTLHGKENVHYAMVRLQKWGKVRRVRRMSAEGIIWVYKAL